MKSKIGRLRRNSHARRGRSHRCFTVRDVGCEGHEKIWTEVLDSPSREGQRALKISTSYPLTTGNDGTVKG